jgi:iron(III) transport system substrate-binding protein
VFEYPVIDGIEPAASLKTLDELIEYAPEVRLGELKELNGTLALLREVGLL